MKLAKRIEYIRAIQRLEKMPRVFSTTAITAYRICLAMNPLKIKRSK
jgi:hypothetical protein